jgi:Spy/CpxP family protein refolding chaperone
MTGNSRSNRTKGILALIAVVPVIIAICVGASFVTAKWIAQSQSAWDNDMPHGHHQWLHEALELTETERTAIDSFEAEYRSQRNLLTEKFDSRIGALRKILVNEDQYVPEVDVAIHRIHEIHGKLQVLSIQHYYDMLNVLPAEKQEKLRELAVKALSQPE